MEGDAGKTPKTPPKPKADADPFGDDPAPDAAKATPKMD
jgi:hypothetical protein